MTEVTKIEVAELVRLAEQPAYRLYRKALQAQFDATLNLVLTNADAPEPALRANIGVLSGLRTALALPDQLIAQAKLQEQLEGQEDGDEPE